MSDYVIVTDSTADLPLDLVQDLDVTVIPMEFIIDGKSYLNYPDEREIDCKSFYNLLRDGKMSTTVQINSAKFTDTFEPFLKDGKDVLYLGFSSGLSGTYHASCLTAQELSEKYPNRKIYTVDTLSASVGEGLLVYCAVQQKQKGFTIEELKSWVEQNRKKLCHWFTVDDLNHLKRGGRVSPSAAMFGTMLGIKPILHIDNEGHLIPVEKIRGRRQSLDTLIKHMMETIENPEEQLILIGHGDALDDAQYVADEIKSKLNVKEIKISFMGPVIGAHTGPGIVSLFFLGSQR